MNGGFVGKYRVTFPVDVNAVVYVHADNAVDAEHKGLYVTDRPELCESCSKKFWMYDVDETGVDVVQIPDDLA
jgi:hypothetical protein